MSTEKLTFAMVDDLAFAKAKGMAAEPIAKTAAVEDLGPFLEYLLLANAGNLPRPEHAPWLKLNSTVDLYDALCNRRKHLWICPRTRQCGVYRSYSHMPNDNSSWLEFSVAAEYAASTADFPKAIAAQLVGAIGEMEGNIQDHSQNAKSGVAVFRATPGAFEFAVADRGIGALKSLTSCPEYSDLADHGEALKLVIKDGVSRFGSGSGRGKGFRPLFKGLANLHGTLRFRSGDHALLLDGMNPGQVTSRIVSKPEISGFYASVRCHVF
jgi:hypothetical protein